MAKLASVKLSWKKSVSADAVSQQVVTVVDGAAATVTLDAVAESVTVDVLARAAVRFKVVTLDAEGLSASSDEYSFVLGDLEAPQPATGLGHQVLSVRDVPDAPPA